MVSIIIVSFNTADLLKVCLESIYEKLKDFEFETVVVDNNSKDLSVEMIQDDFKKVNLIENKENVGFAQAVNRGAKKAKGGFLLFLNSDTKLRDDSLKEMVDFLKSHEKVAVVGGKLENTQGVTSSSYGKFLSLSQLFKMLFLSERLLPTNKNSHTIKKVDWVSGGYMLIRKNVFDALNGFDERFFMYLEDMEFCLRVNKLGLEAYYYPNSAVLHLGQGSSNREFAILNIYKGVLYFYKKHKNKAEYEAAKLMLKTKAVLAIIAGAIFFNSYLTSTYKKALAL